MSGAGTARTALAAVLVLGAATAAGAQTSLYGWNVEGEVELGGRFYIDKPDPEERAKLEEYRDLDEQPFGAFRLGLFEPNERYRIELGGVKIGQDDQEFFLSAGRTGLWRFEFDWDQTPHVFSTNARLLATEPSEGVFTLPTPRPSLAHLQRGPYPRRDQHALGHRPLRLHAGPEPGLGSPARVHLDPQARRPPNRDGVRQPRRQLLRGPAADRPGRPRLPDPRDVVGQRVAAPGRVHAVGVPQRRDRGGGGQPVLPALGMRRGRVRAGARSAVAAAVQHGPHRVGGRLRPPPDADPRERQRLLQSAAPGRTVPPAHHQPGHPAPPPWRCPRPAWTGWSGRSCSTWTPRAARSPRSR